MIKRPLRGIALFLAIVVGTITSFTVRADAGEPSKLGIAFILSAGIESAWDGTLIRDIERIAEAKPHGLKAIPSFEGSPASARTVNDVIVPTTISAAPFSISKRIR